MKLQPYGQYKKVHAQWLPTVPTEWDVLPCRAIVTNVVVKNEDGAIQNYLSLMANVGVIPYEEKGDVGNKKPVDLTKCKIVKTGNLVINSMNYAIGSYGMSDYCGVCSPVYIVLEIKENIVLPRFALRLFENRAFQRYIASFGNGILEHRAAISWDDIKKSYVPIPPKDVQESIIYFLDRETAKIDTLITKQERLIELLQEKRQAMISNAVTKGLDTTVPMKKSGVEWLKEVPEHWDVCQIKRVLSSSDYGISESLEPEGSIPILRMGNIIDGEISMSNLKFINCLDEELTLKTDDILFNRTNSLALVGKVGMYKGSRYHKVGFASYLVRLRANHLAIPDYLTLLFNSNFVLQRARSDSIPAIGQANLNPTRYGTIKIPLPPIHEQRTIVDRLTDAMRKIDTLISKSEQAIALQKEHRAVLISAAVTGKIDVREATTELQQAA